MKAVFFITLFYFYLPVVLGVISDRAAKNGFLLESPMQYLVKKFKLSTHEDRFFMLLVGALVLMLPTILFLRLVSPGNCLARIIGVILVLFCLSASVVYVLTSRVVKEGYFKYSGYIKTLIAISVAINLAKSSSYADGVISELTGVRGSDLPTGLVWLSFIMAPIPWVVTLSLGSLIIYAVAIFGANKKKPRWQSLSVLDQVPVKKSFTYELAPGYAVALSFALLATSPLSITATVLSLPWTERKVREQLVSASFHVKAEKCGVEDIPGAKIAYLEEGKAIIAVPDEKLGYSFASLACAVTWNIQKNSKDAWANGTYLEAKYLKFK